MIIVTVGSGICGLGAALLLARDGHDVTVLEYIGTITPVQEILDGEGDAR